MTLQPDCPVCAEMTRPTLLLDRTKVQRNITRMAAKALRAGLRFRPHFKTHQSATVGGWFREHGVTGITASSCDMARYFARHGWRDITIAFPVNLREMDKINALAATCKIGLLVDNPETVASLRERLQHPVAVWIKVDAGYGRAGIRWDQRDQIVAVAKAIEADGTKTFAGLLSHSGHTYHVATAAEVRRIHNDVLVRMQTLKAELIKAGLQSCQISLGDTPACCVADEWPDVDEIRPGNFVFYDLMQYTSGVCAAEDIAVAVACPVVGKYPERNQVVVYGGAVHLGKESLCDATGKKVFGYAAGWSGESWGDPDLRAVLISLSQEHGVLEVDSELYREIDIGQLLLILPVHSCLTTDLYAEYRTLDGDTIFRLQSNADPEKRT